MHCSFCCVFVWWHIQIDLSFTADLGKLLLMIAYCNDLHNGECWVSDTQIFTHCAGTHSPSSSIFTFFSSGKAAAIWKHWLAHLISVATITVLFQAYLCLGVRVVQLIIQFSPVNLSVTLTPHRETETEKTTRQRFSWSWSPKLTSSVVQLLSAAEEDGCDSAHLSHHSLMVDGINGKASDDVIQ